LLWLNILAARRESVDSIMRRHWAEYGRNFYARHDFEEIDSDAAVALMKSLRDNLPSMKGKNFGALAINEADDFAYHDPVDGSDSARQGVRIMFADGSRIVYRLSGTGTSGATLRVYIERYEPDASQSLVDTQTALADLVGLSRDLAKIERFTGRIAPDVVT
jgi:phosphoglucomutase